MKKFSTFVLSAFCLQFTLFAQVSPEIVPAVPDAEMPASNWQDNRTMTFALDEVPAVAYEIGLDNKYSMNLSLARLTATAGKNNWEAEAGWTLRSIARESSRPVQSSDAYVKLDDIIDISDCMSSDGHLVWTAPDGDWTILRIGHVNTGMKNAPAPPEAVGWECDKLSFSGADAHFPGYISRLAQGPVKGMLSSMLMDSWECRTQTWTKDMEKEFSSFNGYELRRWIPAIFGFVIEDQQTVTGTWFNRLAYDAGLDESLRDSGLLGPVKIVEYR